MGGEGAEPPAMQTQGSKLGGTHVAGGSTPPPPPDSGPVGSCMDLSHGFCLQLSAVAEQGDGGKGEQNPLACGPNLAASIAGVVGRLCSRELCSSIPGSCQGKQPRRSEPQLLFAVSRQMGVEEWNPLLRGPGPSPEPAQ